MIRQARRLRGIFVDQGHVGAVILGHMQACEVKVVVIDVDELNVVVFLVCGAAAILIFGANIDQRLHGPGHAHLVRRAPTAGGLVEHTAVKGDIGIPGSILHQL